MAENEFTIETLPSVTDEILQFFHDVKDYSVPLLEKGQLFDLKQTQASVYWAEQLCIHEDLDPVILIPAVYFHHTGYVGILEKNTDCSMKYKRIRDWNDYHMKISAWIAHAFLNEHQINDKISEFQKYQIVFSILHHDKLKNTSLIKRNIYLNTLIEADTLGQMDIGHTGPTFNRRGLIKYIGRELLPLREPLITTDFGKKQFTQLSAKLFEYGRNM
ncbi:MAG: hypothetical protein ABIC57_04195 [bacterium]